MTAQRLAPADAGEAADLVAFLARLIHWDKTAVVRLQGHGSALAVFGQPPFGGGVLAVRTVEIAAPVELDTTVSAGQLLEGIDEQGGLVSVPPAVTGKPWAGVLPPQGGWKRVAELAADDLRGAAAAAVREFRARSEELAPERRTRAGLDALADEIWSRQLGGSGLPLRAVHAAQALGFLRPVRAGVSSAAGGGEGAGAEPLALLAAGPWLRLRTPYGSIAVRRAGLGALSVAPV
ncbi:hypothetical protein J7I98_05110 [Streptomyces sp. ISL-98]|uniref:hypothetical protein n=1 Tax=Streptomyces sp. ISL-98 TaxID=2819192 RepID=UPI001BE57A9F|nr:hypothetical protein [Streptomyces sp. ISL-98]MBT2505286.1 hypothetical protein [Streptomyces sp. ISL-98]